MSTEHIAIVLPSDFRAPRYMDGLWLDTRRRWADEDLALLAAACDMKLRPGVAADTLGRAPTSLVWKAHELGFVMPREWRALVYSQREKLQPRLDLQYPYIVKPDDKHGDLIAVNRLVSRQLPGREDVCQDIMLALWESRTSLDDLKNDHKAVRAFVKAFRKTSFERGGYAESMDVTLHSDSGDGRSKYEDARYQRTLENEDERGFENDVVREIEEEELSLGMPAALWIRAELNTIGAPPQKTRVRRPKAPRDMVFHAQLKKWVRSSEL